MSQPTYAERKQWRELSLRVKHHDHSCDYSDDAKVWRRGSEERRILIAELQKIPMPVAASIIKRWIPQEFQYVWIRACGILP